MSKLSLIVLTYNSENDIFDCLESVYKYNDIGDGLEVIVVDNNSRQWTETEQLIREKFPNICTISNTRNGGYGQGNNVGIRAASAPIIAIMNPDVRLIMPVFGTFLQTLSSPDVVMCGGKQYVTETKPVTCYLYDHHESPIRQSLGMIVNRKIDRYDYKRMWLSGAFFCIKKYEFEQIGLFNEGLFMYGEEFDIHVRLRKFFPQNKICYLPKMRYLHLIEERTYDVKVARKQLLSDLKACEYNNISPLQCVNNKLAALRISRMISICLSVLRGQQSDDKMYVFQKTLLQELKSAIIRGEI